jgi:hypothetical protein
MAFFYPEPEELPASAEHPHEIDFGDHPGIARSQPDLRRANDVGWTDVVGGIDRPVHLGRVFHQLRSRAA